MEKNEKDTFLTDTLLKQTSRIGSTRFTMRPSDIKKKVEDNLEIEDENYNKKNRETIYDKIHFEPPNDNYYDKFPIKPGINFIKKLFSDEKASQKISQLRINIPETYWNDSSELYYVSNDINNNNVLTIDKIRSKSDVFKRFKSCELNVYQRTLHPMDPFFILRTKYTDYQNNIKIERNETSEENLDKDTGDGILQRFIRSKGRNRKLDKTAKKENLIETLSEDSSPILKSETGSITISKEFVNVFIPVGKQSFTKPSVVRLRYKTKYNPSKELNIAYCLVSKTFIEPYIYYGNKKEIIENYTKLCALNTSNYSTFEIFTMKGQSIKPYEFYANEIVSFVERFFKLTLKSIVIDFIKDERGVIYFLGVKAFSPLKEEILPLFDNNKYLKDDKNLTKIYKTHTCRLCMLNYPKAKITKTVTYKLIVNLKESLLKKDIRIFDHITSKNSNNTIGCKLCDLCYKLLITEQELEEIQKTMALCANIYIPTEDDLLKVKKESIRSSLKLKNLNQFRVLFYFIKIFDIEWNSLPFDESINYKLCIKLMDQKVCIPIFDDSRKFISPSEINLNILKIFYFFTSDNFNLKHCLKNEIIDFRIIINDDWNTALVECHTTCLSFFDPVLQTIRVKTILNFFSKKNEIKPFKCQLYIGINNDGNIYSDDLNMYKYKNTNIFTTDKDYFSHHPLPHNWYELFTPENMEFLVSEQQEMEEKAIKSLCDNLMKDLNFKEIREEYSEIYDPYDQLVMVHNKNKIINKIKSVPIIADYNSNEKIQNNKSRPLTSTLNNKFRFSSRPDSVRVELPIINYTSKTDQFIEQLLNESNN